MVSVRLSGDAVWGYYCSVGRERGELYGVYARRATAKQFFGFNFFNRKDLNSVRNTKITRHFFTLSPVTSTDGGVWGFAFTRFALRRRPLTPRNIVSVAPLLYMCIG